ncbi:hypothetical protein COCON_G00220190 [Conger conger]|uniref:Uncharacterized protein n=1 Tax=Conger conger TaxID=82655 RepID=A0A9Q1HMV1_CONCO|nr:hypothetical protein COCON_G00220190 [Conger conger]
MIRSKRSTEPRSDKCRKKVLQLWAVPVACLPALRQPDPSRSPVSMNNVQEPVSPAAALSSVPTACVTKVELRVSCKALLDRDTLNKSDPCVVIMVQAQGQWTEVSDVRPPAEHGEP